MHDYHMFDRNWYKEFLKFGNDCHVYMNAIKNIFGERARDWVGWNENNASIHRKNLPYNLMMVLKYIYQVVTGLLKKN